MPRAAPGGRAVPRRWRACVQRPERLTLRDAGENDDSLPRVVIAGTRTETADTVEDSQAHGEYGDGSYEPGDLNEVIAP